MERTKVHVLKPGTNGQVLQTVDGEARWAPAPDTGASILDDLDDVDTTTTPPTDGQALVWDFDAGQWVPGTVAAFVDVIPSVVGTSIVHDTAAPYAVTLPDGVDETLVGKFVLVAHWLDTTADVLDDLLALTDWTLLAWTGTARDASGPFLAILGGDPRADVELDAGSGACELTLLGVADAGSFRGLPLPDRDPVLVNDGGSLTGWSSTTDASVTLDSGAVVASAGTGGPLDKKAVLELTQDANLTPTPLLAVQWKGDTGVTLSAKSTVDGVSIGLNRIRTVDMEGDWKETLFDARPGPTTLIQLTAGDFPAGGSGNDLHVRQIEAHPSPRARLDQNALGSSEVTLTTGVPTQENDLLILVGGISESYAELFTDLADFPVSVAESPTDNVSITTRTWSAEITSGGTKTPRVYAGSPEPGIAVAAVSINGISSGGSGGGMVPVGGDDGDVLTLAAGEPVWLPPASAAGTYLVLLTTTVDGEPELVWTEDNQLVYVEETS